jgi:hypothetical protein
MANIKELIQSIESLDSSFDEKLEALNQMEETLVAMRQQEEEAIDDNVDLIVEAINVMQKKVDAQLVEIQGMIPEKGDKGDKGADGKQGKDGRDGKDGKDGVNGKDGADGKDGVSVSDAHIDFDGSLVITLSTGQEINVGEVVVPELQEKIKLVTSGGAGTVLPSQTGNANKYLKTDGSVLSWSTVSGGGSGTVTSVAALTLGTTGTDLSSSVATGTTTPVITLNVPTASATNRGVLSSADWTTFNNKGSGTVTSVTGTSPVVSSGGTTPAISMPAATTSVSGYLTSTDWTTFNNKGSGTVTSVAATVPSFLSVTGSPVTTSGTLAITLSGTALPIANGGTGATTLAGASIATYSGTETLTNKRIDPRVTSAASASSLTPSIATADVYAYTALAANLTINAPTGTPVDGDKLIFRLLDNGTTRTLTWNATYTVIGVTLPTSTTANKTSYIGCIYNANNTRWDVIAVTTQA